ncbi:hypothetical protein HUG15_19925 [Salicibibacter cibarius]|uniref:Uncharacterized protein n=2 Tax=Salicibibacter cibarius TaxID=2743000 RepID=A0A7T7CD49_9BACI|nr:hypothetical protein HUG15_19925 [Salicibibacter cibarius]
MDNLRLHTAAMTSGRFDICHNVDLEAGIEGRMEDLDILEVQGAFAIVILINHGEFKRIEPGTTCAIIKDLQGTVRP